MLIASSHPFLADQYLDLLAIEWQRRESLLGSHAIDFPALAEIDRRIMTYGEALDLLASSTGNLIRDRLDQTLMPGELFAITLQIGRAHV